MGTTQAKVDSSITIRGGRTTARTGNSSAAASIGNVPSDGAVRSTRNASGEPG